MRPLRDELLSSGNNLVEDQREPNLGVVLGGDVLVAGSDHNLAIQVHANVLELLDLFKIEAGQFVPVQVVVIALDGDLRGTEVEVAVSIAADNAGPVRPDVLDLEAFLVDILRQGDGAPCVCTLRGDMSHHSPTTGSLSCCDKLCHEW